MEAKAWLYLAEGRRRGPVDVEQLLVELCAFKDPGQVLVWKKSARATFDKLAGEAIKAGWRQRESREGFAARPDAFAAIRKPGTKK